jgi:MoaA/NifB/PqqE/SkfB family radical SAM enzyme
MNPVRLVLNVVSNRLGRATHPNWCTYLVCYRCNARCGMCDSWRLKPGPELTPAEVHVVFRKIGRLDVVRLTGGEPFLREDFAEVAAAVWEQSRPSVLHITTNGSFPDRVTDFVQCFPRPGRLRFLVSLDGMPEEHNASRGEDVTFELVEETVHRLVAFRCKGVQVSINHTIISPRSLEDHARIVEHFRSLEIDVQAVLAYADSAMYGYKRQGRKALDLIESPGYPLHPNLAGADVMGFVERQLDEVGRIRSSAVRLGKRYYLRGLLARLRGDSRPRPRPRCVALRSHLRLLPDGSVPVCQFNTEKVGNLLRQSFDEVWHGSGATDSRGWVDACTGCWAECEVIPSALYTGDLLLSR